MSMNKEVEIREPRPSLIDISPELESQLCKTIAEYKGDCNVLESAMGSLLFSHHYGTRALQMLHSQATVRKYEKILGIKFADHFPERTNLTTRMRGIRIADKIGAYWKVVTGREPVTKKNYTDE